MDIDSLTKNNNNSIYAVEISKVLLKKEVNHKTQKMGNCCEGESKRNANGAGRSARKRGGQYLQNESTPQHRVEIKDYKKRSKRE